MTTQYTSSPYTRTHEPEIITQLRIEGYDVKEKNNKYYVNGIEIDKNEPLFEAVKRIKLAEIKEQNKGFAQFYHDIYEDSENKRKELKVEAKFLKAKLAGLQDNFYKFLASIGVKDMSEITNESQRSEALKYTSDIAGVKQAYMRNGFDFQWECLRGFDAALKAGSWESMA